MHLPVFVGVSHDQTTTTGGTEETPGSVTSHPLSGSVLECWGDTRLNPRDPMGVLQYRMTLNVSGDSYFHCQDTRDSDPTLVVDSVPRS